MTTQQTDALQCAADLEYSIARHGMQDAFTLNAYRAMKMVRTQHARIAELESQLMCNCERQSIETAPRDGTRILLHPAVEVRDAWSKGHWSEQQGCWMVGGSASGVAHTYWLPLPPAPSTTSAAPGPADGEKQ